MNGPSYGVSKQWSENLDQILNLVCHGSLVENIILGHYSAICISLNLIGSKYVVFRITHNLLFRHILIFNPTTTLSIRVPSLFCCYYISNISETTRLVEMKPCMNDPSYGVSGNCTQHSYMILNVATTLDILKVIFFTITQPFLYVSLSNFIIVWSIVIKLFLHKSVSNFYLGPQTQVLIPATNKCIELMNVRSYELVTIYAKQYGCCKNISF